MSPPSKHDIYQAASFAWTEASIRKMVVQKASELITALQRLEMTTGAKGSARTTVIDKMVEMKIFLEIMELQFGLTKILERQEIRMEQVAKRVRLIEEFPTADGVNRL